MEEKKLDKDINVRSKIGNSDLSDEEIIKALKICAIEVDIHDKSDCKECPYFIKGIDCVSGKRSEKDFYNLILRQKAEIERLTKLVDKWENAYGDEYWMAKHNEILKGILQEVDKESNGQTISVTNVLRKRYGV
jgi:hypothetical protein